MKTIGKILAGLVVLIAFAIGAVIFLVDADRFRPSVAAALTQALHRPTQIGKLRLSLLRSRVEAENLSIAENPAFGTTPFVQAKSAALQVELWPLIAQRKLNVTGIDITEPAIELRQDAKSAWNFATLAAGSPEAVRQAAAKSEVPMDLGIRRLEVTGGRLTLSQPGEAPEVLQDVHITVLNFSQTAAFPFTIEGRLASGGELKFEGTAGPIPAVDASRTPVRLTATVRKLKLDPYGIGGLLSLDGQGSTDGSTLQWTGSARIDNGKFAAKGRPANVPVGFDITLNHNLESHAGSVTRGAVHIGKAEASILGNYVVGAKQTSIKMHIVGRSMPIPELVGLLPALDIQLPAGSTLQGGTLSADLNAAGNMGQPSTEGTLDVADTKLGGFNLGENMKLLERFSGIPLGSDTEIRKLHARLQSVPAGTTVSDLNLVLPQMGELTGSGTVSATHELNFRMRAAVRTSGTVLASLGQSGEAAVSFFIQGTSSNPIFRPDTAAIAVDQIERLRGKNIGGVDAGKAVDTIKSLFGRGKK